MKTCLSLILISFILLGCSSTKPLVVSKHIVLPQPPKRVAIWRGEDKKKAGDNVWWVDKPIKVKEGKLYKSPVGGAFFWNNKDLEAINYGLTEYPRWAAAVEELIEHNNKEASFEEARRNSSWWRIWK